MPNPSPKQTDEFKQKRFNRIDEGDEPLARKVIGVKLPVSIDAVVRKSFSTPQERGAWLRRVITDAVQEELIE